jgi:hypothetical protein
MILEAVPARHSNTGTGHQTINGTSRHYAEALARAAIGEAVAREIELLQQRNQTGWCRHRALLSRGWFSLATGLI